MQVIPTKNGLPGVHFYFQDIFRWAVGAGKIKIRDPRWTHGDPRQLLLPKSKFITKLSKV